MKVDWSPKPDSTGLPAPRIFLSASVPAIDRDRRFLSGPAAPRLMVRVIEIRVRDALASLVVQLLRAGGQLIFGGQPAITPMVAAAVENFSDRTGRPAPVLIYQSEFFRKSIPPAGREEMAARGLAEVHWVPVDPEEAGGRFHLQTPYLSTREGFNEVCNQVQHDSKAGRELVQALAVLRIVMLLHPKPQTILSMGGMEGIGAESALFHRLYDKEIREGMAPFVSRSGSGSIGYALKSTYGGTSELSSARTNFIDETFFGHAEGGAAVQPDFLQARETEESVERQLLERLRYDGVMRNFIQEIQRTG